MRGLKHKATQAALGGLPPLSTRQRPLPPKEALSRVSTSPSRGPGKGQGELRCSCNHEKHHSLGASLVVQLVKNLPAMRETWVRSLGQRVPWRRNRLPTLVFLGFPGGSVGKEYACNAGDLGSIAGLGRCPGEGKDYPLQYPGLENSMDGTVHGVAKSWTRWSDFQLTTL